MTEVPLYGKVEALPAGKSRVPNTKHIELEHRAFWRYLLSGSYTSRTKWFIIVRGYFYVSVRSGINMADRAVETSSRRKRIRYGSS
jgi:hypothetical protein